MPAMPVSAGGAMPAVSVAPPAVFFSPHPASTTRAAAVKRVFFIVAPEWDKWAKQVRLGSQAPPLGLRGQAKSRILRELTSLLDERIPVVAGSEVNDDPFAPISKYARELLAECGDATPIGWLTREQRYVEKLATPDVTIADIIGDV